MGLETAAAIGAWVSANAGTIAAVSGTVAAAGGIASGVQSRNSANAQARAVKADANNKAIIEQQNNNSLSLDQKVAFLNNGVSLEGSPLVVLEETRRRGSQTADMIRSSGYNSASAVESQGRNALWGSVASGIGSGASIYGSANKNSLH